MGTAEFLEAEDMTDLPTVVENTCIVVCRRAGPRYTRNVAIETARALEQCRDPRARDVLIRLLARVEALEGPTFSERERAP